MLIHSWLFFRFIWHYFHHIKWIRVSFGWSTSATTATTRSVCDANSAHGWLGGVRLWSNASGGRGGQGDTAAVRGFQERWPDGVMFEQHYEIFLASWVSRYLGLEPVLELKVHSGTCQWECLGARESELVHRGGVTYPPPRGKERGSFSREAVLHSAHGQVSECQGWGYEAPSGRARAWTAWAIARNEVAGRGLLIYHTATHCVALSDDNLFICYCWLVDSSRGCCLKKFYI